jgi:hypothetical protein
MNAKLRLYIPDDIDPPIPEQADPLFRMMLTPCILIFEAVRRLIIGGGYVVPAHVDPR